MAGEWHIESLESLIDIKHGFAFAGEYIHEEPRGDVLLTPGNFAIGGGFKGDKFKYYDGPVPDDYVLDEGDLIVTMTDLSKQADTLGFPAFVPESRDGRRFLHNQRLGKILPRNPESLETRYLYYVMCGQEYRHEVLASATGTTVKHTSPDRIRRFRFSCAPLPEQRAIAHILGTLDDKIELNRRMSETLEAMARALFKSWFVDFDPVHAKTEGRDPGLPPAPRRPLPRPPRRLRTRRDTGGLEGGGAGRLLRRREGCQLQRERSRRRGYAASQLELCLRRRRL
jgi:type I restriction enzyme S subunit